MACTDRLLLVLGDQLNSDSALLRDVDKAGDVVWMAEVASESTTTASSKQRSVLFFSAMRHFAQDLRKRKIPLDYTGIDEGRDNFAAALTPALKRYKPAKVCCVVPGDVRVLKEIIAICEDAGCELQWLADEHFYTEPGEFAEWANHRKSLRMEFWYRTVRRKHNIMIEPDGQPTGGRWNFDADNRKSFGKTGPESLPDLPHYPPDKITRQVMTDVEQYLPDLAGNLESFNWPVTAAHARKALDDFIEHRLPNFGDHQDAMWTDQPWLYHSLLSSSINLKLLNPRDVVNAALDAFANGHAELNAVEGFVRQIVGWREYIRGVYWLHRHDWLQWNSLSAEAALPKFYWTADTDMQCLRQSIDQVLQHGYGHHIQRLMVTGLFAQLVGVVPEEVHDWYLAMYVDAIAWVEVPNTIGMSQYADGGVVASKPYIASGAYINRMSNYCKGCKYAHNQASGDKACPFTTLYWDFIDRHTDLLAANPRLALQVKNWNRKDSDEQRLITKRAQWLRQNIEQL